MERNINLALIERNLDEMASLLAVIQRYLESANLDSVMQSHCATSLGIALRLTEEASEEIPFPNSQNA